MSKRNDILDAFYSFDTVLSVANGYSYDWTAMKSRNNGSYATQDNGAVFSVKFSAENCDNIASQNQFFLSDTVIVTGLFRSVISDTLDENDIDVQYCANLMIEDMRRGFCDPEYTILCSAGCYEIIYAGQNEEGVLTGDGVIVSLKFTIKWFDERS